MPILKSAGVPCLGTGKSRHSLPGGGGPWDHSLYTIFVYCSWLPLPSRTPKVRVDQVTARRRQSAKMLQNPPSPPRGAQRVRLGCESGFSPLGCSRLLNPTNWARSSAAEEDQGCVAWGVSAPLVPYRCETLCLKQRWGSYTPSTTRRLVAGHPSHSSVGRAARLTPLA